MADRIPNGITREHILAAIDDLKRGVHHRFGNSTTYDLLQDERRYPPKAVLGLAAGRVTGEPLGPYDFKAGLHSKCFRILGEQGFSIVPKDAADERRPTPNGSTVTRMAPLPNRSTLAGERLYDSAQKEGGLRQMQVRPLVHYHDYTRGEVHDVFDPTSMFTPQAGTWGLQGIIEIPQRPRDFVFFVTFGKSQAAHEFDEGITPDGVLRWQSQPKQRLADRSIQNLIAHNEDTNSIYLFLRTASRRNGIAPPYTYLGRLKYQAHDIEREQPVYFTWKILDWDIPDEVRGRIYLQYEEAAPPSLNGMPVVLVSKGLIQVSGPTGSQSRRGLSTSNYLRRIIRDYAEQDSRNRQLGLAGEEAVMESERNELIERGRADLAEMVRHVAKLEGDGAGYDIKSYTPDAREKFIEVKTTCGDKATAFYLSSNEIRFAADHVDSYHLYRVFEFDQTTSSGKVFVHSGDLTSNFSILPVQFKAVPAFD